MQMPSFDHVPSAIALDLDDTLLNGRSELSKRNREAIEKCLSHGLPVIFATSRPERSVRRLIGHDLVNRCSLVMMNGAIARGIYPLAGYLRETITPEVLGTSEKWTH
jgi:hydroxymethylpyrimidine pyrophosphatase-like HAD family hydrolase